MPTLPVDRLAPGMILTADVTSLHGQLLIATGRELTERHLSVLKAWGVETVEVKLSGDAPAQAPDAIDAASYTAARGSLQQLFRRQDFGNPVILELFEVCASRKARRAPLSRAA